VSLDAGGGATGPEAKPLIHPLKKRVVVVRGLQTSWTYLSSPPLLSIAKKNHIPTWFLQIPSFPLLVTTIKRNKFTFREELQLKIVLPVGTECTPCAGRDDPVNVITPNPTNKFFWGDDDFLSSALNFWGET